jgi:hypothetical protein
LKKAHGEPLSELPDEVLAVLDCSLNLLPCKKFRHANIYRFADHIKNGTTSAGSALRGFSKPIRN